MISIWAQQPRVSGFSHDFTTGTLPAGMTFTRAGTRNAIVSGALVSIATGTPAYESWDGVSRGMAIEAAAGGGAVSQLLTQSNTISDASWTALNGTKSAGGTGPDGVSNSLTAFAETTANGVHSLTKKPGSQAAGTQQTMYTIVKRLGTSTRWAVRLRMSDEFNNSGPIAVFRIDGTPGFYVIDDLTRATGATAGVRKLANNLYLIWLTGTWVNTGNKEFTVSTIEQTASTLWSYTGVVTEGFECYGMQVTTTPRPVGWVATTTTALSQPVESAVFSAPSWLTASQGTFIVEHDCTNGPLVGSGAVALVSGTVVGKTAFAWDAGGSDTVNNGGATSAGASPTVGSDIRLLSTNAVGNVGHIKSIRFEPRRMSVAEMQAATTPTVVSTATPGVLRAASIDNRLPSAQVALALTQLNFASRYRLQLGGSAMSSLKLDFANIFFPGTSIGNSVVIDECYLERVTTVAESVQVLFAGASGATLASGSVNNLSDAILPGSFTGLSNFPANTEFWIRVRGHVASASQNIPVSRARVEAVDSNSFAYDPATVTLTNFTGTGALTKSGVLFTNMTTNGLCPILVGVYATGDPKTMFVAGDSIIEGVNGLNSTRTWVVNAARALGIPVVEFSLGGSSQLSISEIASWKPYLAYCRVYCDDFGTNNENALLHFFTLWNAAKATYGHDKIVHVGLLPRSTSSDSWATEANQTAASTGPALNAFSASALLYKFLDSSTVPQSIRGVANNKWKVDGNANTYTADGVHPSALADGLMKTEIQPVLDALVMS